MSSHRGRSRFSHRMCWCELHPQPNRCLNTRPPNTSTCLVDTRCHQKIRLLNNSSPTTSSAIREQQNEQEHNSSTWNWCTWYVATMQTATPLTIREQACLWQWKVTSLEHFFLFHLGHKDTTSRGPALILPGFTVAIEGFTRKVGFVVVLAGTLT